MKNCKTCGIEYDPSTYNNFFCSENCRYTSNKNKVNKYRLAKRDRFLSDPDKYKDEIILNIYKRYNSASERRKHEFTLTIEEFGKFFKQDCYYCGDPVPLLSLDRMDNDKGYIPGNIVSCCTTCNYMKQKLDIDSFIKQCEKVLSHIKVK